MRGTLYTFDAIDGYGYVPPAELPAIFERFEKANIAVDTKSVFGAHIHIHVTDSIVGRLSMRMLVRVIPNDFQIRYRYAVWLDNATTDLPDVLIADKLSLLEWLSRHGIFLTQPYYGVSEELKAEIATLPIQYAD